MSFGVVQREQFKFLNSNYSHLAGCEIVDLGTDYTRSNMPDASKISAMSIENDKVKINLCRKAAQESRNSDAVWLGLQIENERCLDTCVKMLKHMKKFKIVEELV